MYKLLPVGTSSHVVIAIHRLACSYVAGGGEVGDRWETNRRVVVMSGCHGVSRWKGNGLGRVHGVKDDEGW